MAQAGDTVLICGGTYHETVTPANSGSIGAPITYEPYNGQHVVVDGADPITGWSLESGSTNIYEATMNWSFDSNGVNGNGDGDQNQVFVDGQMMTYARWPNTSLDVSHPTFASATTGSYQRQRAVYRHFCLPVARRLCQRATGLAPRSTSMRRQHGLEETGT